MLYHAVGVTVLARKLGCYLEEGTKMAEQSDEEEDIRTRCSASKSALTLCSVARENIYFSL